MSPTFTHRLEILSNIAVIVAAVAVCFSVARQYLPSPSATTSESFRDKTLNMASITLTPATQNVVLVLSQSCRFCEEEMPFYRTLGEIAVRAKTHVYAMFPPTENEPDKYLERHSVRTDGVVSGRLDGVGVRGTPTLLLVDANGKIERAWVGALNDAQEKGVLQAIQRTL